MKPTKIIRDHRLAAIVGGWQPYAVSLLVIAATTALLLPFRTHLDILNVALIFLIVITLRSLRATTWPSVVASVLAFLAFDFFFVPPYITLTVGEPGHVLALFVFLGITILVSQLIVRIRARTEEALRRGRQTATLYDLSATLIGEIGLDDTLAAIAGRVREVFSLDTCAILLALDGQLELRARATVGEPLDLADGNLASLARWVLEKRQSAGLAHGRARLRPPGPAGDAIGRSCCCRSRIDLVRRVVTRAAEEIHLTPTEYDLLRELALNAGRVLTHQMLLSRVWGPASAEEVGYLRVYVNQLRCKIEPDPTRPRYIVTEPGVGYRFRDDVIKRPMNPTVEEDL